MKFALSKDTRALIQCSTGLDSVQQCSIPISEIHSRKHVDRKYCCPSKKAKDLKPRGSIYLQMGRILSLKAVKSYLKSI